VRCTEGRGGHDADCCRSRFTTWSMSVPSVGTFLGRARDDIGPVRGRRKQSQLLAPRLLWQFVGGAPGAGLVLDHDVLSRRRVSERECGAVEANYHRTIQSDDQRQPQRQCARNRRHRILYPELCVRDESLWGPIRARSRRGLRARTNQPKRNIHGRADSDFANDCAQRHDLRGHRSDPTGFAALECGCQ
jgi:hypothetical protein